MRSRASDIKRIPRTGRSPNSPSSLSAMSRRDVMSHVAGPCASLRLFTGGCVAAGRRCRRRHRPNSRFWVSPVLSDGFRSQSAPIEQLRLSNGCHCRPLLALPAASLLQARSLSRTPDSLPLPVAAVPPPVARLQTPPPPPPPSLASSRP